MALATLGFFVFTTSTIPYQNWQEEIGYRHPSHSVVGDTPKSQFTGKDQTEITLSGALYPEVSGGENALAFLEIMGNTGQSYPLIGGDGTYHGAFVIKKISKGKTHYFMDGTARKIDFSLSIAKVADMPNGLLGDLINISVRFIKGLF